MDLGISGRRAAVAAASQGLGFATASALAEAGVAVAVCSRDRQRIEAAAAAIGERAVPLVVDVSTEAGGTDFVAAATAALGGVDILVCNAGGPPTGNFATTDLAEYRRALDLNCLSAIAMCHAAVPGMREAGWGRVVAITSIAVKQPIANLILSNTARAGLTGFLKTLARELIGTGVTVNSLLPGLHETERMRALHQDPAASAAAIEAGTMGRPADFGQVAAFICSEHARFLNGAALQVDGGAFAGLL
jgi:3-oxoacyl-[acyl-carrier protein] reductase